jgi:hypothetical protein
MFMQGGIVPIQQCTVIAQINIAAGLLIVEVLALSARTPSQTHQQEAQFIPAHRLITLIRSFPLVCAQISIATGLPLAVILIKALPGRDGSPGCMDALTGAYAVVMLVMGVLVSWPQTHNSAMFSEARGPACLGTLRLL